jgi:hypothetical protein
LVEETPRPQTEDEGVDDELDHYYVAMGFSFKRRRPSKDDVTPSEKQEQHEQRLTKRGLEHV